MIGKRLERLPDLNTVVRILDDAETRSILEGLQAGRRGPLRGDFKLLQRFQAEEAAQGEVANWLSALPINGTVVVIWVPLREAVAMPYPTFVEHFDDLWLPSADDVWVVDQGRTRLVELSHEEELTFYERR